MMFIAVLFVFKNNYIFIETIKLYMYEAEENLKALFKLQYLDIETQMPRTQIIINILPCAHSFLKY